MKTTAVSLAASLLWIGAAAAGPMSTGYPLDGTVALGGCSGALFLLDGQSMDDDALVLTNGHCIGTMGQYEVLVELPYERELVFYDASDERTSTYLSSHLVYATMHQTDMAILRVDATYQELADAGVTAFRLSPDRPSAGIDIVVPSGLWEYTTECVLDGFVHTMKESRWTWTDSLRYTEECVTFGGTSGSPVVSIDTGDIIGVNNTGYEGGEPCSFNNPCEVDENGDVTTIPDGSYGQQTFQLYSCVDGGFGIDLDRTGCDLPGPTGVLRVAGIELSSDQECDADGNLDPGETAIVSVSLFNEGPVDLVDTTLLVTSPSDAVDFSAGASIQVDAIPGFETVTVEVPIALSQDARELSSLAFEVTVTDPGSAEPEVQASSLHRVNYDDVPNSSTTDDVESNAVPWDVSSTGELEDGTGWSRVSDADANTVWYAPDVSGEGDQFLVSPTLEVGGDDFIVRFSHRYAFETSRGTFWDGGVIEVSTDGGDTWTDAGDFASDFGYGGVISDEAGNPLANRDAFVDASPDWPERSDAVLDFGDRLAGESVRLRFRLGTDRAAGDFGWEIDDISAEGIENLPFSSIEELANSCDPDPPDDEDDPPIDEEDPPEPDGGCSVGGSQGAGWLPLLFLLAVLRRRGR